MKIQLVTILFFSALAFALLSNSGGRAAVANSGNTGAPGEAQTCGNCHNGNSSYGNISIAVEFIDSVTMMPVTILEPNWPYRVRMTISNSGAGTPNGYGGQLTILDDANVAAGNWLGAPAANTKVANAGSRTYMEQTSRSSSNVFEASWRAPGNGVDTLFVYASGNAVNGNNATSNDASGRVALKIPSNSIVSNSSSLNNLVDFDVRREAGITFINVNEGEPYQVELIDAQGRKMWRSEMESPSNEIKIQDGDHAAGVYFLAIYSAQKRGVVQLLLK